MLSANNYNVPKHSPNSSSDRNNTENNRRYLENRKTANEKRINVNNKSFENADDQMNLDDNSDNNSNNSNSNRSDFSDSISQNSEVLISRSGDQQQICINDMPISITGNMNIGNLPGQQCRDTLNQIGNWSLGEGFKVIQGNDS